MVIDGSLAHCLEVFSPQTAGANLGPLDLLRTECKSNKVPVTHSWELDMSCCALFSWRVWLLPGQAQPGKWCPGCTEAELDDLSAEIGPLSTCTILTMP